VPLEGAAPAIGVFDTDLNYITHAPLPNALDATWCAINPVDGYLYTSSFRTGVVRKHRMSWTGSSLALTEVASIALRDSAGKPLTLQHVQGGAFSARATSTSCPTCPARIWAGGAHSHAARGSRRQLPSGFSGRRPRAPQYSASRSRIARPLR
jgi:hypothetical protein